MIDQLKEQIFIEVGKEIVNRGDCEHLSRLIEIKTGAYLNYNTLRRFFDLDKQKFKPRISTLDILSKYIGYLSFEHFSSFKPQKVYFDQNLKMYDVLNTFNPFQLSGYFNNLDANYNLRLTYMVQVCRHGLLSKQIPQLCAALEMMNFREKSFSYDEKLIIGNSVGLIFRTISLSKRDWKALYKNAFFNEYIFEIFVDYSSLNTYYFGFIANKAISEEQRHFKNELMNLYHFLNKHAIRKEQLDTTSSGTEGLNPILRGRIISRYLYDGSANEKMILSLQNLSIEYLYEPMVATILSSNFVWFNFFQMKLNVLIRENNFRSIHYFQVYLLMKTCFLYKMKEFNKAKRLLNEIKLQDLRFSYREILSFFYYLLDYKLNQSENAKIQAHQLSQKLNYARFDQNYIQLY